MKQFSNERLTYRPQISQFPSSTKRHNQTPAPPRSLPPNRCQFDITPRLVHAARLCLTCLTLSVMQQSLNTGGHCRQVVSYPEEEKSPLEAVVSTGDGWMTLIIPFIDGNRTTEGRPWLKSDAKYVRVLGTICSWRIVPLCNKPRSAVRRRSARRKVSTSG